MFKTKITDLNIIERLDSKGNTYYILFDNKKETERRIVQDDAKHLEEVLAFKNLNELYG